MRAVFRYAGSKWGLADWIIEHFPADYENMVYLEPFAGSAAVFFNKKPGIVETINDLNGDVVNLFRVLRDCPEELIRKIQLTPYSREEFRLSTIQCDDPVEKARRFMVRTTQSIGAKPDSGWRNHKQAKIGGTACKWNGLTETLDTAAARLKGNTTNLVQIENMDALQLIEKYNYPDVLMYLDPPYVKATRRTKRLYCHEMDDGGQNAMLDLLTRSKAKIILSGYQSELYDTKLPGWRKDKTETRTTSTDTATETIWMNYDPPVKQFSIYDLVGGVLIIMTEEICTEWRTARKEYSCDYCGGKIKPGERYEHYTGKYDGDIYVWKAHERCVFVAHEIWDYVDPDEGMDADAFYEGCSDVCRTFVCPDCGKWDTDECDESYCMDKLVALFQKKELYKDRRDRFGATYWKLREREKEPWLKTDTSASHS